MTDRVLIADGLEEGGLDLLEKAGVAFDLKSGLSPDQLLEAVRAGYAAIVVRSASKITREVLQATPGLRIVARAGVGVDNIDVPAASERGVLVVNAPEGNTLAAAEHTVALMLALARHVPAAHQALSGGKWERKGFTGVELYGKVLGVIGLGKIGRTVAQRCAAFQMEVLGYDPFVNADMARTMGVTPASLDEIFTRSDFITLHVPLTDETRGVVGAAAIGRMKPSVRIVNCARGGLVDEAALAAALREGKVAGAAFDVFASEPPEPGNPLLSAPNVVLTPHLGASTHEAQARVGIEVVQQVVDYLARGTIRFAVNAPALPPEEARAAGPYMDLATRLGRLQAQLVRGSLREIVVEYQGDFSSHSTRPITTSLLAGFLSRLTDDPVNYVNAPMLVKKRGIAVQEIRTNDEGDFARLLSVTFVTDAESRKVSGTLLGGSTPRLVRMEGYDVDALPEGTLLFVSNTDRAGVVGSIGTILGRHGLNIAGMSLGRDKPSGRALAIINVDSPVPVEVERELCAQEHVLWVKTVHL